MIARVDVGRQENITWNSLTASATARCLSGWSGFTPYLMHGAGFDARLSAFVEYEMWEKWTMLRHHLPDARQYRRSDGCAGGRIVHLKLSGRSGERGERPRRGAEARLS